MVCIRCKRNKFGVVRTKRTTSISGRRNSRIDMRRYYCLGCGKQYEVECEMKGVPVYDKELNIEKIVPIQEYIDVWLHDEIQEEGLQSEGGLFDEEDADG